MAYMSYGAWRFSIEVSGGAGGVGRAGHRLHELQSTRDAWQQEVPISRPKMFLTVLDNRKTGSYAKHQKKATFLPTTHVTILDGDDTHEISQSTSSRSQLTIASGFVQTIRTQDVGFRA